jgi:endonuclease YncB( thermonuclease family)
MGICNCKQYYKNNQLKKCTSDMPLFTFNELRCHAKVVSVYDGDTFKACIYRKNEIIKINCRTLGYDSAEMKPRLNIKNRDEHIKKAKKAKQRFIELTTTSNSLVYLDCHKFDKYGRVLVVVHKTKDDYNRTSSRSINQIMIDEGQGVPYDGGTKTPI